MRAMWGGVSCGRKIPESGMSPTMGNPLRNLSTNATSGHCLASHHAAMKGEVYPLQEVVVTRAGYRRHEPVVDGLESVVLATLCSTAICALRRIRSPKAWRWFAACETAARMSASSGGCTPPLWDGAAHRLRRAWAPLCRPPRARGAPRACSGMRASRLLLVGPQVCRCFGSRWRRMSLRAHPGHFRGGPATVQLAGSYVLARVVAGTGTLPACVRIRAAGLHAA